MSFDVDRSLRFETFVVGASNRLAASAARAVADSPGEVYNPLFIYGNSGRGKTHLVAAIAACATERNPDLQVMFSSGEEVAEHLTSAIAEGSPQKFAGRYRQSQLLILDDVQFLTGQRETQNELLRLLNLMMRDGQQLVLTSDRQPSEIPDVDQRLLSRLSGGLIVDVGAPDFEMRLAILRSVCADRQLEFQAGVLEEVARLPFANVRELKGALNKLSAFQQLEGDPIAASDVRAVLGDGLPRGSSDMRNVASGSTADSGYAASSGPGDTGRITAIIPTGTDYEGFLADVLQEVEFRVEPWRVRLGEAIKEWDGRGYAVSILERAMALPSVPDVDGLLRAYKKATERLQDLERQAVAVDPVWQGHAAFRNPEDIPAAAEQLEDAMALAVPLQQPSTAYKLSGLSGSAGMQLALQAAQAVLSEPGRRYNPLLIHGPSGSGKTHLAHAIANAALELRGGMRVACLSANTFLEEFVIAMQDDKVARWRRRYRAAEMLVLDDVHNLMDKERTQEELFHIFNHLVNRGCQVVLTADRPPNQLSGIVDRLRSRFEGGLVVELPERERVSIQQLVRLAPGELDRFFEDREKTIWDWPDLSGRLMEDYL